MAVATAAIGGLVIAGVSAGASFSQASKQRKLQAQAEQDATKAMAEARKKLDVNFAEKMSVKKEAYDLEREALLSAGAQATEAGMESERGSAATAGRVYAAQQAGQAGVRGAMADEMTNIENSIIEEDGRLRDLDVALDLEEVAGNQQKAADAQARAEQAKQQGIQSTLSAAQSAMALAPLYSQNTSAQKKAVGGMSLEQGQYQDFGNVMGKKGGVSKSMGAAGADGFTNLDLGAVGDMSNRQFRQFKNELTPQQKQMLFQNEQYVNAYSNPFAIK